MAQQNIQFIRKVTRVGGRSLSIVIPSEIVSALGIRERQKLTLELDGERIIVRDWKE
ncbi:MAG: AbrB/MazE/SpoVT family DNA-binding domain-containing protein [Candidatus Paceibacterota bacterium]